MCCLLGECGFGRYRLGFLFGPEILFLEDLGFLFVCPILIFFDNFNIHSMYYDFIHTPFPSVPLLQLLN